MKARVPAECHSDDWEREADFDAAPWLLSATEEDVLALVRCDFGGDYGADAVAEDLAKETPALQSMFDYLHQDPPPTIGGSRIGFECHVDGEAALALLEEERPDLYRKAAAALGLPVVPATVEPGNRSRPSGLAERALAVAWPYRLRPGPLSASAEGRALRRSSLRATPSSASTQAANA